MSSQSEGIQFHSTLLEIVQGDITTEQVDAIVNAANAYLQHGGGVAGSIVRRGGQVIQQESDQWVQQHGRVVHAHPAYTSAGRPPCSYVIHAVGPIWGEGEEDQKLSQAITGTLDLAQSLVLKSIAFPAISTGIYGFPKERAARIMLQQQVGWLNDHPETSLALVRDVLFDSSTYLAFQVEFARIQQ